MKRVLPETYARLKFKALGKRFSERELRLLPYLCDLQRTSIDIGAAEGLYVAHMIDLSLCCIAFEARPKQAGDLQKVLSTMKGRASVEAVALSNCAGTATLRILVNDPGRSTIESGNALEDADGSARTQVRVPMRRLDEYAFENVGFIKIDVEGHELAVIQGAEQTICRNRPSLLIEIEDRHRANAIADVSNWLMVLDYAGFFLLGDELKSFHEFEAAKHQDSRNIGGWKSKWERTGIYINNFIFVPKEREAALLRAASGLFQEGNQRQPGENLV